MSHKSRKTHEQHLTQKQQPAAEQGVAEHGHGHPGVAEPAEPELPPRHDQPWIPKSGLVGRKRRSPRQ